MGSTAYNPTSLQRHNLRWLALALRTEPMPRGHKFNMTCFAVNKDGDWSLTPEESICGTQHCALGMGPLLGFKPLKNENWHAYSKRVFGVERDTLVFDWLFSSVWEAFDNTRQGAADRMDYLLNHRRLPEEYDGRIAGMGAFSKGWAKRRKEEA